MPKDERKRIKTNQLYDWSITYYPPSGCDVLTVSQPLVHFTFKHLCKKFVYQVEKCPTTGRLHFQCCVSLKTKKRNGELGGELTGLGMKGCECLPASNQGKIALKTYCMKNESRVHGPWADHRIYMGEDLMPKEAWSRWMFEIEDMLKEVPHHRKIYWYYDQRGNRGKSIFSKYMWYHHKVLCITVGKVADILNVVMKYQNLPMYIFDISRSVPEGVMNEIYCALEHVKSGYFINTKYETGVVCMARPHVVVFSNHLPKLSSLSKDMLVIRDLSNYEPNEPRKLILKPIQCG